MGIVGFEAIWGPVRLYRVGEIRWGWFVQGVGSRFRVRYLWGYWLASLQCLSSSDLQQLDSRARTSCVTVCEIVGRLGKFYILVQQKVSKEIERIQIKCMCESMDFNCKICYGLAQRDDTRVKSPISYMNGLFGSNVWSGIFSAKGIIQVILNRKMFFSSDCKERSYWLCFIMVLPVRRSGEVLSFGLIEEEYLFSI